MCQPLNISVHGTTADRPRAVKLWAFIEKCWAQLCSVTFSDVLFALSGAALHFTHCTSNKMTAKPLHQNHNLSCLGHGLSQKWAQIERLCVPTSAPEERQEGRKVM